MDIAKTWAKATTERMKPGGDLYRRPLSLSEMTAPLSWFEAQLAVVCRFGDLGDGTVGWLRIDNRGS